MIIKDVQHAFFSDARNLLSLSFTHIISLSPSNLHNKEISSAICAEIS